MRDVRRMLKGADMKVIFDKVKLLAVLSPAMGCISTKSTFTSMEGVLINAGEDGKTTITTYDMDKGVFARVDAEVVEPGSYILNAQDLFQYVKVMPEREIELEVTDKLTAFLRCNRVCYTMRALNGKEFPTPPELDGEWGFVMEQAILKTMIGHTQHSISAGDSNHPELCGAYLKIEGDHLTMVACDTFTLSKCIYTAHINTDMPNELSMIIPGKSVAELQKMLSDDEEELMTIKPSKKHIVFVLGDLIFFSRLIDLKYIDYERIIQKDMPILCEVDRHELLECLERASLVSEKKSMSSARSCVKLNFTDNVIKISSTSLAGQINDEVHCKKTGEDLEIGFACRYLIDILRALDCERVCLNLKGARVTMNVYPIDKAENKEQFYLVMPVKITD